MIEGREIALGDRLKYLFEDFDVVGVREEIAMQHHVDPNLRIVEKAGSEHLLDDVPGRHGLHHHAGLLQVILDGLPGQLKGDLESLDGAFFLQSRKGVNLALANFANRPNARSKLSKRCFQRMS